MSCVSWVVKVILSTGDFLVVNLNLEEEKREDSNGPAGNIRAQ